MLTIAVAQLSRWVNPMNIAQRSWVRHRLPSVAIEHNTFFATRKCFVTCFRDVIATALYTLHTIFEQNSDGEVLSTHTNVLVLYLHLCAWILNRLCTARSVYVGQSYAKCSYKSTQYTYKLLICTTKMSGEDETKCVELTALEKNNESKEINQRSFAVSNKNTAGSKQDCNRKWRWIKLRPMRAGTLLKMHCLCTPFMGC